MLSRRVYEQVVATHARVVLVELVELCGEWEALFGDKNVLPELFFQIQRKSPGQHPDGFHWRVKYKIACPKTIHSDLLPSRLSYFSSFSRPSWTSVALSTYLHAYSFSTQTSPYSPRTYSPRSEARNCTTVCPMSITC